MQKQLPNYLKTAIIIVTNAFYSEYLSAKTAIIGFIMMNSTFIAKNGVSPVYLFTKHVKLLLLHIVRTGFALTVQQHPSY
jgi:hypothetical protein